MSLSSPILLEALRDYWRGLEAQTFAVVVPRGL